MILDKVRSSGWIAAALLACGLACACGQGASIGATAGSGRLPVVVTISTLSALVQAVGGDRIAVTTLVPVGVSPETYDPRPANLAAVSSARLIVENGAGLESWLEKLLRSAAPKGAEILVLSSGMPIAQRAANDRAGTSGNPHLWLDPVYAQEYVKKISAALVRLDPANASFYAARSSEEVRSLQALDAWIRRQVAQIPPPRRSAIVFHDAWYYFDRRYGIRDVGVIEPTAGVEPSAEYFARLIDLARREHVGALFGEPQFSPKLVRQFAEGAGTHPAGTLYDDTLGTTPALSTYEGVMRYDVGQMVKAMAS